MLIHKYIAMDEFKYKSFDEDTWHYLLDQIRERVIRKDLEFDYLETDKDLVDYMWHVMDDDTELYIIPASLVEWSPYDTWYFIY